MKQLVIDISARRKAGENVIVSIKLSPKLRIPLHGLMTDDYGRAIGTEPTYGTAPNESRWKILGEDQAIVAGLGWGNRTITTAIFRARGCFSPQGLKIELQYPIPVQDIEQQLQELKRYAMDAWRQHVNAFAFHVTVEQREVY